jgi:hypothetical protein
MEATRLDLANAATAKIEFSAGGSVYGACRGIAVASRTIGRETCRIAAVFDAREGEVTAGLERGAGSQGTWSPAQPGRGLAKVKMRVAA